MDEFGRLLLRANADGSTVRLKDVARIELGAQLYATSARPTASPRSAWVCSCRPAATPWPPGRARQDDRAGAYFPRA